MSIHLKTNAVGLDRRINRIIGRLNASLNVENNWGIEIYGKVYRNTREVDGKKSIVPEVFTTKYIPVFVDDTQDMIAFIPEKIPEINNGTVFHDVDIAFSLQLDNLSESTQREDEKAFLTAKKAVEQAGLNIIGVKKELPDVYSDFDWSRYEYRNMQPWINFSFTVKLTYKNINCNELL